MKSGRIGPIARAGQPSGRSRSAIHVAFTAENRQEVQGGCPAGRVPAAAQSTETAQLRARLERPADAA